MTVKPDNEAALAEAIKSAHTPFRIEGGGTCGALTSGETLSVAAIAGITLYEPGALTLVAQAGTPLADVEKTLASEGQRLAFEPPDFRALLQTSGIPTIGGVMATNAGGPRRIQGGAARDYALGVRFVDGVGNVIKNGGRVMKNVTGYDLVKLMCGAYGTLGVLTEVSLKVLPVPETSATLILRGLDPAQAVKVMAEAMGSPFEVTGAAHGPLVEQGDIMSALRVEGFEQSVSYRVSRLRDALASHGAEMDVADGDRSTDIWARVRDAQVFSDTDGDIWRISCKPSQAAGLVKSAAPQDSFFDRAGGLIWMRADAGSNLREKFGAFDGHATLIRASKNTRATLGTFHPETPGIARLTAGLRARFDPKALLNPGLMDRTRAAEAV